MTRECIKERCRERSTYSVMFDLNTDIEFQMKIWIEHLIELNSYGFSLQYEREVISPTEWFRWYQCG